MKAKPGTPGRGGKKKHSGGWKGKVTLCFLSFLLAGANLSRAVQPSPPSSKVTPYKCKGIHGSFVSLTCLFLFTLCLCSRHFALRKRIRVCRNQKPIKICKGFGQGQRNLTGLLLDYRVKKGNGLSNLLSHIEPPTLSLIIPFSP